MTINKRVLEVLPKKMIRLDDGVENDHWRVKVISYNEAIDDCIASLSKANIAVVPEKEVEENIETIIHGIRAFASYEIGARIYGEGVDNVHLQRAITAAKALRQLMIGE